MERCRRPAPLKLVQVMSWYFFNSPAKGGAMAKKRYSAEQIIQLLREVKIHTSVGKTISQSSHQIGVTEQTYYRWRKEYGGLNNGQAKRLKNLEKENSRLKRLVSDLSLDNVVLKDFASGNL